MRKIRMNEKRWKEALKNIVGKTYDIHEWEDDVNCECYTECPIYFGYFEKVPFESTEFIEVHEEGGGYMTLKVYRDFENETIEIIDGWV